MYQAVTTCWWCATSISIAQYVLSAGCRWRLHSRIPIQLVKRESIYCCQLIYHRSRTLTCMCRSTNRRILTISAHCPCATEGFHNDNQAVDVPAQGQYHGKSSWHFTKKKPRKTELCPDIYSDLCQTTHSSAIPKVRVHKILRDLHTRCTLLLSSFAHHHSVCS